MKYALIVAVLVVAVLIWLWQRPGESPSAANNRNGKNSSSTRLLPTSTTSSRRSSQSLSSSASTGDGADTSYITDSGVIVAGGDRPKLPDDYRVKRPRAQPISVADGIRVRDELGHIINGCISTHGIDLGKRRVRSRVFVDVVDGSAGLRAVQLAAPKERSTPAFEACLVERAKASALTIEGPDRDGYPVTTEIRIEQ